MATKTKPLGYTDGIVSGGVIEVSPSKLPHLPSPTAGYAKYCNYLLHATTNGQTWSYELRQGWSHEDERTTHYMHPSQLVPTMGRQHRGLSLLPEVEDLLAWALKDAIKRKVPCLSPQAVAAEQVVKSVKLPGPRGPITYFGYGKRIGAYTLEQIHDIVAKAVADCSGTWKWANGGPWVPSNLQVKLHTGQATMGLAFNPGSGVELNKRVISLNKLAFTQHDAKAIWRLVVHEICHHYRDEALPQLDFNDEDSKILRSQLLTKLMEKKSTMASMAILNSHDIRFVKALGQVDPEVAATPVEACWFAEYADKSVVAVVEQQRGVQWAAGAGKLVMKVTGSKLISTWVGAWGKYALASGFRGTQFLPFDEIEPKIGEGADKVVVEFDDKLRRMFEQVYARSSGQAIILPNDLPLSVAKPLVRAILKKPS